MPQDSCARAAQAAIEVVREECGGMDMEVREVEDGLFMEIPKEDAQLMDNAAESPVPLDNFERVLEQSDFIRKWIAGVIDAEGVEADPDDPSYAERVHMFGNGVFEDGLAFTAEDLVGSEPIRTIAAVPTDDGS